MKRKLIPLAVAVLLLTAGTGDAYRYKSIRITAYGAGSKPVHFSGWCEVGISNKALHRTEFAGVDDGMEPLRLHARRIDRCELQNDSGRGTITLILHENDREIFRRTSREGEAVITYGPTMQRFSTKPYPFNKTPGQHTPGTKK